MAPAAMNFLFFLKTPELKDLVTISLEVDCPLDSKSLYCKRIMKCRELIFTFPKVIATPEINNNNQILAVLKKELFKDVSFREKVSKMGLKLTNVWLSSPADIQDCLHYTAIAKLAPAWNIVDNYLVQGRDFLTSKETLKAISMELIAAETEIHLNLTPVCLNLPRTRADHYDTTVQYRSWLSSGNATNSLYIPLDEECYVLPSLKRARLMSITNYIPEDSIFKEYKELKKHWKNMYGYRLPEESDSDMWFGSVVFRAGTKTEYTYPLVCVAPCAIEVVPRMDPEGALPTFLHDFQRKVDNICGSCTKLTDMKASFPIRNFFHSTDVFPDTRPRCGTTYAIPNRKVPPRPFNGRMMPPSSACNSMTSYFSANGIPQQHIKNVNSFSQPHASDIGTDYSGVSTANLSSFWEMQQHLQSSNSIQSPLNISYGMQVRPVALSQPNSVRAEMISTSQPRQNVIRLKRLSPTRPKKFKLSSSQSNHPSPAEISAQLALNCPNFKTPKINKKPAPSSLIIHRPPRNKKADLTNGFSLPTPDAVQINCKVQISSNGAGTIKTVNDQANGELQMLPKNCINLPVSQPCVNIANQNVSSETSERLLDRLQKPVSMASPFGGTNHQREASQVINHSSKETSLSSMRESQIPIDQQPDNETEAELETHLQAADGKTPNESRFDRIPDHWHHELSKYTRPERQAEVSTIDGKQNTVQQKASTVTDNVFRSKAKCSASLHPSHLDIGPSIVNNSTSAFHVKEQDIVSAAKLQKPEKTEPMASSEAITISPVKREKSLSTPVKTKMKIRDTTGSGSRVHQTKARKSTPASVTKNKWNNSSPQIKKQPSSMGPSADGKVKASKSISTPVEFIDDGSIKAFVEVPKHSLNAESSSSKDKSNEGDPRIERNFSSNCTGSLENGLSGEKLEFKTAAEAATLFSDKKFVDFSQCSIEQSGDFTFSPKLTSGKFISSMDREPISRTPAIPDDTETREFSPNGRPRVVNMSKNPAPNIGECFAFSPKPANHGLTRPKSDTNGHFANDSNTVGSQASQSPAPTTPKSCLQTPKFVPRFFAKKQRLPNAPTSNNGKLPKSRVIPEFFPQKKKQRSPDSACSKPEYCQFELTGSRSPNVMPMLESKQSLAKNAKRCNSNNNKERLKTVKKRANGASKTKIPKNSGKAIIFDSQTMVN